MWFWPSIYVFQTWMFMNLWCTTFYGVENCFCYGLVLFFNLALKLKALWPFIIFSQVMQSLVIVTQYFLSFCITKAVTEHYIFCNSIIYFQRYNPRQSWVHSTSRHGLPTPRERERAFFKNLKHLGFGQTFWTEIFLRHLGYFRPDY